MHYRKVGSRPKVVPSCQEFRLVDGKNLFRFSRMSPTRFLIAARWPLLLVPISAPTPLPLLAPAASVPMPLPRASRDRDTARRCSFPRADRRVPEPGSSHVLVRAYPPLPALGAPSHRRPTVLPSPARRPSPTACQS